MNERGASVDHFTKLNNGKIHQLFGSLIGEIAR
jgi:hypothetical protein